MITTIIIITTTEPPCHCFSCYIITSHAEIRSLIMKFWMLMLEIFFRWSRRIYSQWLEEEIRRKNSQHHHRLHLLCLWLFLKFIHLYTRLHLQSHLQSHLQLHMLHIQLHIQLRMHLSMHLSTHLCMTSFCMSSLLNIQISLKRHCIYQANQLRSRKLRLTRWKIMIWRFTLIDIFNQNHINERSCDLFWIN